MFSGILKQLSLERVTALAHIPSPANATTRSPTANRETFEPTASITPDASKPGTYGYLGAGE